MTRNIEIMLLTAQDTPEERKQQAMKVAKKFRDFVGSAKKSIHIAIYDFRLDDEEAEIVIGALNDAAEAGRDVRVAYFQPKPRARKSAHGGDKAPKPDSKFLKRLHKDVKVKAVKGVPDLQRPVKVKPIDGGGHLMHSKYIIRDSRSVWKGSANFTTDAWSIQDNNIVIMNSPDVAAGYETDFNELWKSGRIAGSGKDDHVEAEIDGIKVEVDFAPGDGEAMDQGIADLFSSAESEIVVASMVISSPLILGALVDAIKHRINVWGIYDGPEMRQVERAWSKGKNSGEKMKLWNVVKKNLVAKESTPYSDNGPHDFMHNKLGVVDRRVVKTGSFNFSRNATKNAENIDTIHDEEIAARYRTYVKGLVTKYGKKIGRKRQ